MAVKIGGVVCDRCRKIIGPTRASVVYWRPTKKGLRIDFCGAKCSDKFMKGSKAADEKK